MAAKVPAKTQAKGKGGGRTRTTWKKGMPSPNPTGRPKDGESWKAVIATVSNMTAEEIAEMVGGKTTDLGRAIALLPRAVQVKYLVTARVIAALMFEPTAGLWEGLMNRMDGKVKEELQIEGLLNVENLPAVMEKVYGKRDDPG